jgi:hypothetical protein
MRVVTRVLIFVVVLAGCAGCVERSTRLTGSDFEVTVQEMANSLAASEFLAERSPTSPEIRIVTRQALNLTSDVITPAEQWMLVARVQSALPVRQMAEHRNIVFQMPPEEIARLRARGFESELTEENRPTHLMTATLRSSLRAGASDSNGLTNLRKDYYLLEYQILEIETRRLAWSGRFEFAREAAGLVID